MRLRQPRPFAGVRVEAVLVVALASGIEHAPAGQDVDRRSPVRFLQETDDDRRGRLAAADHADVRCYALLEHPLMQPVAPAVEDAGVVARLAGDRDRRSAAGEYHAVGGHRLAGLDLDLPATVAADIEADDLARDDLGLRLLGDVAKVGAPLPMRRTHAATVDPVGVCAPFGQVALPREPRHRRAHRRRRRSPAGGVGEADVFLGRRTERQKAARVALPPAPVSSDLAPVDEDDMRRVQADGRKGADLGGDRDPLRSCADDSEGRHHPRIVPHDPLQSPPVGPGASSRGVHSIARRAIAGGSRPATSHPAAVAATGTPTTASVR